MPFVFGTSSGYHTFADDLLAVVTGESISALVIDSAGTGYVVGDEVAISGGTSSIQGTAEVTAVGGSGEVTGVRVLNAGLHTVTPGAGASTTGGTGSGLTLDVTIAANGWEMKRDTNVGGSGEREVIVEGEGTGGDDEIFVGWRTFADAGSGARNIELAGFTGFSSGLAWNNQPGISPGRHEQTLGGAYVVLSDGTINWWVNVSPRRIAMATRIGSYYGSAYVGLLNPFATAGEWPYPLAVMGSTTERFMLPTSNVQLNNGVILSISNASTGVAGPGFVRLADGTWHEVANTAGTTSRSNGVLLYPTGRSAAENIPDEDDWYGSSTNWSSFIPINLNLGGTSTFRFFPTPGTAARYTLVPATLFQFTTSAPLSVPVSILGELDGVYWLNAAGAVLNENRIEQDGNAYRVFQAGVHTAEWAKWALQENA